MKDFIKSHTALNHAELCKLTGWHTSSFNLWMSGKRGIPKAKEQALKEVLKDYGYIPEEN